MLPWMAVVFVVAMLLFGLTWERSHAVAPDAGKGQRIYHDNCKQCHGSSGKGEGYTKLNPRPADLTSRRIQETVDAELIKTIHAGRANTAMGTWRLALSDEEIDDVVAYIRTLAKRGPVKKEK
jgi:mono/diheme cytochrome c family protein